MTFPALPWEANVIFVLVDSETDKSGFRNFISRYSGGARSLSTIHVHAAFRRADIGLRHTVGPQYKHTGSLVSVPTADVVGSSVSASK